MSEFPALALAIAAGGVFGAIFYGGHWWTVLKGVSSKVPALWFLGSLLVRMSVLLAGVFFVSDGHWERMLACLLGVVLARVLVDRLTRTQHEVGHASQLR